MRRRDLLPLLLGLLLPAACRPKAPTAPQPLVVPLAEIPEGRSRVVVAKRPVELLRRGTTVTARSLRCTHQGCEVKWNEASQLYKCPCHQGEFDAAGRVVQGAPERPLQEVVVTVANGTVRVEPPGAPAAGGART